MTVGERFVGQRVLRHEDPRFLTGRGRYVDDIPMPGVLHVAFVRSDVARGRIVSVDTSDAATMPGVVAVYANGDLDALFHNHLSSDEIVLGGDRPFRLFAADDVRCVGEPIAMIVADSRYRAEDAVDSVVVEIEAADPVVDFARALDADAPIVHAGAESNLWHSVPPEMPTPELDALIESAPVVLTETFHQHRYATVPMETRGVLASWEPSGEQLTVWISTQGPHNVRAFLARALALDESQIRVIMPDVGGAFGLKMNMAGEEIADGPRVAPAGPAGEVDPGPAREPDGRRARARRPGHGDDRGRGGRNVARGEGALRRRRGRVPGRPRQRVGVLRDAVSRPVPDPRVRGVGGDGAHQHPGPRLLPGPVDDRDRRARADDRLPRREARHGSVRAAPPQRDPRRRTAVRDADGHGLRPDDRGGHPRPGRRDDRLRGAARAAASGPRPRAGCGGSGSASSRSRPRCRSAG